jgi:glucose dehydrogenase
MPPGKEWPLVGGDWGNTRYSTLRQINTSNVKGLKGAWMTPLNSGFGPGFSQQATPVVRDGVLYITTGEQDIFALDAKTGRIIWEYRTTADPRTPGNRAKRASALARASSSALKPIFERHPLHRRTSSARISRAMGPSVGKRDQVDEVRNVRWVPSPWHG